MLAPLCSLAGRILTAERSSLVARRHHGATALGKTKEICHQVIVFHVVYCLLSTAKGDKVCCFAEATEDKLPTFALDNDAMGSTSGRAL